MAKRMSQISADTENKAAADLVRDRDRLAIATEAASHGIYDHDIVSGRIDWDDRVRAIWGLGSDAPVDYETFLSGIHSGDRAATQNAVDKALDPAGNGRYYAEYRVIGRKDGVERWVAATGRTFFDQGRAVRLLGTVQDISERKRAEEELVNRLRFEMLLTEISARFVSIPTDRIDQEIEDAQRRVCECLDLDGSTLWQWTASIPSFCTITHSYRPSGAPPLPERIDAQELFPWSLRQLMAGKLVAVPSMKDLPAEAALDQEIWRQYGVKASLTISLVVGSGSPIGFLSFNMMRSDLEWNDSIVQRLQLIAQIFANALSRMHSDRALRKSQDRLIEAQRLAKLGDWEWDPGEDSVIWSLGMYDLFERSRELPPPAGRQELSEYYTPESWARLERAINKTRETGEPYEIELEHVRADGAHRWHLAHGEVVRDGVGRTLKLRGTAQDITERKQSEDELQQLNSGLEQLVAERTAEATNLAAQLRELASESMLAEQRERQRIAKVLHDHIQQLLVAAKLQAAVLVNRQQNEELKTSARLVTDMIDQTISASRDLTADLIPPVLYDAGLGPALQWLARNFLEKHGLHVEVVFSASGEPQSNDVRVFMFDAVREILFNVVKHSGVQIAHVECFRAEDDCVHVVVWDQGEGFDTARFQTREKSQGFGLFSIQQRLKHLGGRLEIDSIPGGGTRITIVGPPPPKTHQLQFTAAHAPTRIIAAEKEAHTNKIRVVLADDHHIIRQGLASLLRIEPDIEIVGEASNGVQAINLARSHRPDVVVMDLSMPVLNGVEATVEILRDMPDIKVIGLSMHEDGELSSAIRQAGAVAYVTKGGPPEALVAAIRKAAGIDGVRH